MGNEKTDPIDEVQQAAEIKVLFALEELAIRGGLAGRVFTIWKDGKRYAAPPDSVEDIFKGLRDHMREVAPAAKAAMDAYHNEDVLKARVERAEAALPTDSDACIGDEIRVFRDGNAWFAVRRAGFTNIQDCLSGIGDSVAEAVEELLSEELRLEGE